jgi:hypothetical protein
LIKALKPSVIDSFAYRFTSDAAEMPLLPVDHADDFIFLVDRKLAVEAAFRGLYM